MKEREKKHVLNFFEFFVCLFDFVLFCFFLLFYKEKSGGGMPLFLFLSIYYSFVIS